MKKMIVLAMAVVLVVGLSPANAGDAEKGKALFESRTFGDGTNGKSCKSCHIGGKNLGPDLFERKKLSIMGQEQDSLAGIVNVCIKQPMGGTPIDPNGEQMEDLLAYLKALATDPNRVIPEKPKPPKKPMAKRSPRKSRRAPDDDIISGTQVPPGGGSGYKELDLPDTEQ